MQSIKPSVYLNIAGNRMANEAIQDPLVVVQPDTRHVVLNQSAAGKQPIRLDNLERVFTNLSNGSLIEQTGVDKLLSDYFLRGYNCTLALLHCAQFERENSILGLLLSRIGRALGLATSHYSNGQHENIFLDVTCSTADNQISTFESIDDWTTFVSDLTTNKSEILLQSNSCLSFRFHVQDEFVSILNVVLVPEVAVKNFGFVEQLRAVLMGNSILQDAFFESIVKMLFQNTRIVLIASGDFNHCTSSSTSPNSSNPIVEETANPSNEAAPDYAPVAPENTNETTTSVVEETMKSEPAIFSNSSTSPNNNDLPMPTAHVVELLSTLDLLAQFKGVIFPSNLSKARNQHSFIPAVVGYSDDHLIFQDYQNASLRVVEALEFEMNKIKQAKDFISKELSLLKKDITGFQRDAELRFELLEVEENKKRETEELLYTTRLQDLFDQLNEKEDEFKTCSEEYRENINNLKRENESITNSLSSNQLQLQELTGKLSVIQSSLLESRQENSLLSTKLVESQSKQLTLESNYQSQLSILQKTNASLQQSIARLEGEKRLSLEEVEEKSQSLQAEIAQLQAKLDKSAECNKATQTTIRSLNREKNELNNKIDELQEKCTAYEEEQRSLQHNLQELRKRKDSSRSATTTRFEDQLDDERKAHVETQARLEVLEASFKEQVKDAVNKERSAVKNERIEMQKLLKESQERIIELEELLQQKPGSQSLSQGNPAKRSRTVGGGGSRQKHSQTSNQIESEEENLPSNTLSKNLHISKSKFGNDIDFQHGNEVVRSPLPNSKMPRAHSSTRSQIPVSNASNSSLFSSLNTMGNRKASGNSEAATANRNANASSSVVPPSPKKLSTFAPKASFMPSFNLAPSGEQPTSGASILAGVSFDSSFVDATKRTRLAGSIQSNNLPQFEHQRVLRVQPHAASTAMTANPSAGGSTSSKRPIPNDILNDFKIPAVVSK